MGVECADRDPDVEVVVVCLGVRADRARNHTALPFRRGGYGRRARARVCARAVGLVPAVSRAPRPATELQEHTGLHIDLPAIHTHIYSALLLPRPKRPPVAGETKGGLECAVGFGCRGFWQWPPGYGPDVHKCAYHAQPP